MSNSRLTLLLALILGGVVSRLIAHPPNFTAIEAASIFAGATLNRRTWSLLVPLISMFLSDALIGFHPLMWVVYLSICIGVALGWFLNPKSSLFSFLCMGVLSSVLFFLITNFAVWLFGTMYPKTEEGLLLCYLAGLPFFKNMLCANGIGLVIFVQTLKGVERFFPSVRSTLNSRNRRSVCAA